MEAVIMPSGDAELCSASSPPAAASDEADPLDESLSSSGGAAHLNGELNGSSAGEDSDPPPAKRVRVSASVGDKAAGTNNKDKVLSQKAVSDSSSAKKNTKPPIVVELSSDVDSPVKTKTEQINNVKRKLNIKSDVTECDSPGNDEKVKKDAHRNGDIEAGSERGGIDSLEVSLSSDSDDTPSKVKNHKDDISKNGGDFKDKAEDSDEKSDDIQEIDQDDNDIEEIKQDKDIKEIKRDKDSKEIKHEKDTKKMNHEKDVEEIKPESKIVSEEDPLDLDTKKRNGEESSSDDKKDDDDSDSKTPSTTPCSSPEKQKINDARRKSAEAKRQALLNITPRRSSRNLNKQKKYIDGEPEPTDEPDIEEILPVDPLAVSASERVKMSEKDPLATTPEKEAPKIRRKNTIIVNDTKALAQIAANSKEGKKEPTLVIIDTNSILSGRGPVPVSAPPSLPAALPAQGIYPVMHHAIAVHQQPTPPKPQAPPAPPKPKGPVGLTDDMYVVEAPSFIVPYVYEKPPKEPLKEVVEKMGKILREQDKKEREEKQKEKKRKEKAREERELKAKEEKKNQQEEKEKQDKLKAEKGEEVKEKEAEKSDEKEKKSDKKDDEEEPMEVDKDTPVKPKKTGGEDDPLSDKEDEEEPKADHDSDYKEEENKDKGDSDEDEDVEYDSESDSSTSGSPIAKPKPSSYFESPLGKFFMQIGVNLVQEHVQTDLLRMQKRKLQRGGGSNNPETQLAVQSLLKNLEQSKENNKPYKFQLHKCKFCNFKTESNIVLANHLEIPHLRNFMYHCNFCPVALRTNHDILFHMEAEHNIHGRIERAPAFHQCPNCPFEDNQKSKMTRHALSCTKRFRPERNCEPPMDWEPPAKIPRMAKSRPAVLPGSPTAAQYMAQRMPQGMPQHPLLPKIPAASMMPTLVAGAVRGRGRPAITSRFLPDLKAMPRAIAPSQMRQAGMMYNQSTSSRQQLLVPTSYQIAGNQIYQRWSQQVVGGQSQMPSMTAMPRLTLMPHSGGSSSSTVALVPNLSGGSNSITIQSASSKSPAAKLLQQPSISITPLPRQPSSSSSNSAANFSHPGGKQGQVGGKNSFVICEICDGYIKDLEQLRNHMQWIHKVKIHPKMIYNRPPLNCQKCQFRFFTDQGLERHLLGSHGLVTSSMQEASNKGKDGGRCPVCGRVYQWKLLNHVAKDHNMTLKPAHLSYKCTVCTATFGMYKQFENHVYSAHSVVAKRVMDKKAASNASSSHSRSFSHSSTESLLKPLKINDEITIIPQPAKPSSSSSARGGSHRKAPCQADDSGSENSL